VIGELAKRVGAGEEDPKRNGLVKESSGKGRGRKEEEEGVPDTESEREEGRGEVDEVTDTEDEADTVSGVSVDSLDVSVSRLPPIGPPIEGAMGRGGGGGVVPRESGGGDDYNGDGEGVAVDMPAGPLLQPPAGLSPSQSPGGRRGRRRLIAKRGEPADVLAPNKNEVGADARSSPGARLSTVERGADPPKGDAELEEENMAVEVRRVEVCLRRLEQRLRKIMQSRQLHGEGGAGEVVEEHRVRHTVRFLHRALDRGAASVSKATRYVLQYCCRLCCY